MLKLTTPCFLDGGWIPNKNSGYGMDLSPEFRIDGIDNKTISMIITLDDLSHPLEKGYNHWIAWNIPPIEYIPGSIAKGSIIENPIHIEQGIGYGKHCYRGPKPPFNWKHEYLFTIYTLDCKLDANKRSRKVDIIKLAKEHILQKAEIRGWYQMKHKD